MMEENNEMTVFGRANGKKYSTTFLGGHLSSTYVPFSIPFPCTLLCTFCMTPGVYVLNGWPISQPKKTNENIQTAAVQRQTPCNSQNGKNNSCIQERMQNLCN